MGMISTCGGIACLIAIDCRVPHRHDLGVILVCTNVLWELLDLEYLFCHDGIWPLL